MGAVAPRPLIKIGKSVNGVLSNKSSVNGKIRPAKKHEFLEN